MESPDRGVVGCARGGAVFRERGGVPPRPRLRLRECDQLRFAIRRQVPPSTPRSLQTSPNLYRPCYRSQPFDLSMMKLGTRNPALYLGNRRTSRPSITLRPHPHRKHRNRDRTRKVPRCCPRTRTPGSTRPSTPRSPCHHVTLRRASIQMRGSELPGAELKIEASFRFSKSPGNFPQFH